MSTFLEAFSKDKRSTYIISNVPYSCVDHFYSTVDDLLNVFEVLDDYTMRTNLDIKSYSGVEKYTKSILLIIDEAHLYLGARESLTKASILNKLKLIFTQCRKRKIRIVFITQRLTQIDIYVRRLADYVEEYHRSNFL
ncbi:ATP-binding protein [bacterium]|nr:ATP-binding protein [bacterium]